MWCTQCRVRCGYEFDFIFLCVLKKTRPSREYMFMVDSSLGIQYTNTIRTKRRSTVAHLGMRFSPLVHVFQYLRFFFCFFLIKMLVREEGKKKKIKQCRARVCIARSLRNRPNRVEKSATEEERRENVSGAFFKIVIFGVFRVVRILRHYWNRLANPLPGDKGTRRLDSEY